MDAACEMYGNQKEETLKANEKKTSDENVVLLLTATIQESTHDVSGLSSERPPTTAGPAPAVFFGSSILVQSG